MYHINFDNVELPDIYDIIPKDSIQKNATEWARVQDIGDSIQSIREAKKHFTKVLALKHYSGVFLETQQMPLPTPEVIQASAVKALCLKSDICLLTINPRSEILYPGFKKVVEKYLKSKILIHYYQVYEVRKGIEGLHAHILIKYSCPPYEFQRYTKAAFSKVCDSTNSAILNFKFIDPELIDDKISYLNGQKKDSKQAGVADTIAFRLTYGIPAFTQSVVAFPCKTTEVSPSGHLISIVD